MCDKENLKPPLVARQNTSRLPVPVRKKQSHYYKADAISAVELPLSTTLKAPHRKQQSTSKSLGKGKPDAQQTPRELLLTTILEEWRSRMHIKITDRHMLVSASAVDRQRLISHAFHQWSIARRQQQLDRLQLLKSDRFHAKSTLRSAFKGWQKLNTRLDYRRNYPPAMLQQIDSRRRRMLMRRYFYGWRTHEQCDPVIRRHSMLALLWWSRSVYRAAWQQWRERYCYLYLGRLVEERADKVYQVSLLTAAVECWRVELYCRLNERLLEERAGKIYRRLVLYRFAGCWLRQLNQQQMERALTKRADRFRSGWLLASGLHRWRLLSRRLWAREHQIDVEQAGWLVRSNWNQWLRLYRQRAEQTGKSIALRFANQQKRLKHGLHEWLNQAQLLIIMNGSAVESHRLAALRFAFGLWRQSSAAHRADRQYQTKLRKIAFSHWQTRTKINAENTARAMALEMKHRRHLLGQTFERLCKQASKMQQLRLNSSSFQLNVQAKLQSIVVRSWRQQVVSARTEQLALWNQTLKRKYFSLWSQTAGDQRKADRHYNFLLSQASLMIWRQRFEALKHRQTQQVFDDWLSGRLADEHSPTDPNENCSQRSNQTEKASQFRPAIEQSMHIRDIDEEISFIEDRLIEYQTEKESMQRDRKLLQSLCAVAGGKPSKQWKYDLLSQKLQRYDSDEVNRRQDVQALCNRLMELKSIVQRKL